MGRCLDSKLGWTAAAIGLGTELIGCSLGFFTMDYLLPHIVLAGLYFCGVMLMAGLFAAAIGFSPSRSQTKWPLFSSVGLFLLCATFVTTQSGSVKSMMKVIRAQPRPDVWPLAAMEWAVIAGIGFWFLTLIIFFARKQPGAPCAKG
jgi:hypothetical protein